MLNLININRLTRIFVSFTIFTGTLALAEPGDRQIESNIRPKFNYFPTKQWRTKNPDELGFNTEAFKVFTNYVFNTKAGFKTDSLVVIKDGYLVYEQYANGYQPDQRHMLWSFSKSIANAILGVAEYQGLIKRDDLLAQYIEELNEPNNITPSEQSKRSDLMIEQLKKLKKSELTLAHLMHMSSGIEYYEEHPANIVLSDSVFINYSFDGYQDMAKYMTTKPLIYKPGAKFNYSSGECNLAMYALKKAIENRYEAAVEDRSANLKYPWGLIHAQNFFPWDSLFNKIGMHSTSLEQDLSGNFVAGSFGWSTARDIAKLALLYLNNGNWAGEQLFPKDWVKWSLTTAPSLMNEKLVQSKEMRLNQEDYGAYWWLNKALPMNKGVRPYPDAPESTYLAMGYKGQTLAVIPEHNLIVVRLGNDGLDSSNKINRPFMLKLLLESLKTSPEISSAPAPTATDHEAFSLEGLGSLGAFLKAFWSRNTSLDDGFVMSPAKDLCSCVYLVKHSQQFCMDNHEQYQMFRTALGPLGGIIRKAVFDDEKKSVTISNTAHSATASFVNDNLGCKMTSFVDYLRGGGDRIRNGGR